MKQVLSFYSTEEDNNAISLTKKAHKERKLLIEEYGLTIRGVKDEN